MINNENDGEIPDKFETEIISQNRIAELEKERDEAYVMLGRAYDELIELKNKRSKLSAEIEELESKLHSK